MIDLYDAYNATLTYSKENTIQAELNFSINQLTHIVSQMGAKSPTPFRKTSSDFLFKPRVNLQKEKEELIHGYS